MASCKHRNCHGDSCIYKVPIFAGLDEDKVARLERLGIQQRNTGGVRLFTWRMSLMSLSILLNQAW